MAMSAKQPMPSIFEGRRWTSALLHFRLHMELNSGHNERTSFCRASLWIATPSVTASLAANCGRLAATGATAPRRLGDEIILARFGDPRPPDRCRLDLPHQGRAYDIPVETVGRQGVGRPLLLVEARCIVDHVDDTASKIGMTFEKADTAAIGERRSGNGSIHGEDRQPIEDIVQGLELESAQHIRHQRDTCL